LGSARHWVLLGIGFCSALGSAQHWVLLGHAVPGGVLN